MRVKWDHLIERVDRPGDWLPFDLIEFEERALNNIVAPRYLSGQILADGFDSERRAIPVGYAAWAFIATAGDGGDIGTVPLVSGTLGKKIEKLFNTIDSVALRDAAEYYAEEDDADEEAAKRLVPFKYRFFGE